VNKDTREAASNAAPNIDMILDELNQTQAALKELQNATKTAAAPVVAPVKTPLEGEGTLAAQVGVVKTAPLEGEGTLAAQVGVRKTPPGPTAGPSRPDPESPTELPYRPPR
jgi:hypothetical protein